jgi:hypothetical protein
VHNHQILLHNLYLGIAGSSSNPAGSSAFFGLLDPAPGAGSSESPTKDVFVKIGKGSEEQRNQFNS